MKKILVIMLLAVAAAGSMIPATTQAETFRLTIGAGHPVPAASWVAPMQTFLQVEVKKRVEQKTGHKIEWVEAYGGSVAKLGEVLEAVENGLMDIGDVHGYDPLWFTIVAIVSIEIGLLTPPFGMVVFAMRSAIGETVQVEEIFAGALPFILMLGLSLGIILAFPRLSTWLPSLM